MPRKQLSNLGEIMGILSITAKELSKEINIDQTSISRWRTGVRKPPVDMSYFDDIINYFIKKNELIGGGLIEDFLDSYYFGKRRKDGNDLKKYIRNYILSIPNENIDSSDPETVNNNFISYMNVAKHNGAEGRFNLFINLLETAEKLTVPSVIKIFESDQLNWASCSMQYSYLFFQKVKSVLNLGHKIEFIFQAKEPDFVSLELHQMFLELAFHKNLSIYIYSSTPNKLHTSSLYILSPRMAIVGYCIEKNLDDMLNCLFRDRQYIDVQEIIWQKYKAASAAVLVTTKHSEIDKIIAFIRASNHKNGTCFCFGKSLSNATMSYELLNEILDSNHLNKEQKRLCFEFYSSIREDMECCNDPMSGFYYVLDEITAPLAYPTITNYALSAIAGQLVQMSREQYLRHFRDTAQILLNDTRYRVLLHYSTIPTNMSITRPNFIWYKSYCWTLIVGTDGFSGKTKFMYGDNLKVTDIFGMWFIDVFNKVPDHKKDNNYVAELFMKIANGEKI